MKGRRKNHKKQESKERVRHYKRKINIDGEQWSWKYGHPVRIKKPDGETVQVNQHDLLGISYQSWYNHSEDRKNPGPAISPGNIEWWVRMNLIPNPYNKDTARKALKLALKDAGVSLPNVKGNYESSMLKASITKDNRFEFKYKPFFSENWNCYTYTNPNKLANKLRFRLEKNIKFLEAMLQSPHGSSDIKEKFTEKDLEKMRSSLI